MVNKTNDTMIVQGRAIVILRDNQLELFKAHELIMNRVEILSRIVSLWMMKLPEEQRQEIIKLAGDQGLWDGIMNQVTKELQGRPPQ